jgi:hypothetical protein
MLIRYLKVRPPNSELNRSLKIKIKGILKKENMGNNRGILLSITRLTINLTCLALILATIMSRRVKAFQEMNQNNA